jgi:hypothetical protein
MTIISLLIRHRYETTNEFWQCKNKKIDSTLSSYRGYLWKVIKKIFSIFFYTFYSFSALMYLKFICIWGIIMAADYLLEFRFEFLWPFWLVLRSIYDSFKYQGLVRKFNSIKLYLISFFYSKAFLLILCIYCIHSRSYLLYIITSSMAIFCCK